MNIKYDLNEILSPIESYISKIDDEIKKILQTGVPLIDNSSLHLFLKGGKWIRASLVILISGIKGSVPVGIIPIAAASEIVHAATLIHDDIIDQSLLRRGSISVPQKWGNKVSVLVGDFMYTEALNVAVLDGDPRLFPVIVMGARDMVMGELYQMQYSNIDDINTEHYYKIIELKTARFMAACAKLGAIKGGFTDEECEVLYSYGMNLGFAFQIIDDTLDYFVSEKNTGKDEGNDFKEGKITLPVLRLLEGKDREKALKIRRLIQEATPEGWIEVRHMVRESDVLYFCSDIARKYIDTANEIIFSFPESGFRDILYKLSQFFLHRNY